jgi:hypothetical protein
MNGRLAVPPIGHRLRQPIVLPIGQLQAEAKRWVGELTCFHPTAKETQATHLLNAVLHEYFVDATGQQLTLLSEQPGWTLPLDAATIELKGMLHLLIKSTVGPLMPSYLYRFEVLEDALHIIPSQPTISDYEERITAMVDPEDGWVPDRHRR